MKRSPFEKQMNSKYISLLIFLQLKLRYVKAIYCVQLTQLIKTLVYEFQCDKLQNHILQDQFCHIF